MINFRSRDDPRPQTHHGDYDAFAEKLAKGSVEFMEQTTHLLKKMPFLNCTVGRNANSDVLVDKEIQIPSAAATVQSDMTEVSISDQPGFPCEGAIVEWLRELEARKEARQKAEAVRNLRRATDKANNVREALQERIRRHSPTEDQRLEHEGLIFTCSDAPVLEMPGPVYSKSLF